MSTLWSTRVYVIITFLYIFCNCEQDELQSYDKHGCKRQCDGNTRVCKYIFTLEWYYIMSRACHACPNITTDCFRPHCISADGVAKPLITVNRMLPGPGIHVCENDIVQVTVRSKLQNAEGTSIHWHGIHQRNTPWMDGVSQLTQCAIPADTTFTYRFAASPPGTHYWHAHSGMQRTDGVFGALVVRDSDDDGDGGDAPGNRHSLYDYDRPEHHILVHDWLHVTAVAKFTAHHYASGNNKPKSMLINGLGIHKPHSTGPHLPPRKVFSVKRGYRYRFRVINNINMLCPITISIEAHSLSIIATDGYATQPLTVDALTVTGGERFDFVVTANQSAKSAYWIKARGLADCAAISDLECHQTAILEYEGGGDESRTMLSQLGPSWMEMATSGESIELNPFNQEKNSTRLYVTKLKSLERDEGESNLSTRVKTIYLSFDFNHVNNTDFHHPKYYPLIVDGPQSKLFTPQMNGISFALPNVPPLTQYSELDQGKLCTNPESDQTRFEEYHECYHIINVALNEVVEIVLVDRGFQFNSSHPFHLHGGAFRVTAMEKLGHSTTVADVKDFISKNAEQIWHSGTAVKKDSVVVSTGGFTVIRFIARNPGFWFFHCHLVFHSEVGMGVVLQIGDITQMPPAPRNFPRCGDWNLGGSNLKSSAPEAHRLHSESALIVTACQLFNAMVLLFSYIPSFF